MLSFLTKKENLSLVVFMIIGIFLGMTIGKFIYAKELPDKMVEIPELKTGNHNETIFSFRDSSYRVIVKVDSAIERGNEFY